MPNPTTTEYIARINRTFDYIEANLAKPFTLQELASVASFSKFHYNRIFYGVVGETPFQFITRVRLERAATLLLSPGFDTVTDVAFKVGFVVASEQGYKFRDVKIETRQQAQNHCVPFTIYNMFYNGKFLTQQILTEKSFGKMMENIVK